MFHHKASEPADLYLVHLSFQHGLLRSLLKCHHLRDPLFKTLSKEALSGTSLVADITFQGVSSIPGWGAEIPHASQPKIQNTNRSNIITNSIQTLKIIKIKHKEAPSALLCPFILLSIHSWYLASPKLQYVFVCLLLNHFPD